MKPHTMYTHVYTKNVVVYNLLASEYTCPVVQVPSVWLCLCRRSYLPSLLCLSIGMHSSAVANGPAGVVLAGPVFLKVKAKFHFLWKQVINKSASLILNLLGLLRILCFDGQERKIKKIKIIGLPCTRFVVMLTRDFIVQSK